MDRSDEHERDDVDPLAGVDRFEDLKVLLAHDRGLLVRYVAHLERIAQERKEGTNP